MAEGDKERPLKLINDVAVGIVSAGWGALAWRRGCPNIILLVPFPAWPEELTEDQPFPIVG